MKYASYVVNLEDSLMLMMKMKGDDDENDRLLSRFRFEADD